MSDNGFISVWDAIENTASEAEALKLRSALMMALNEHVETSGLTHAEAAKAFGVTQPRVADLKRGKINVFRLEALIAMASTAGLRIELRIGKESEAA